MTIFRLFELSVTQNLSDSLWFLGGELSLSAAIVMLLLFRLCSLDRGITPHWVALAGALATFLFAWRHFVLLGAGDVVAVEYFQGMLKFDAFTGFIRLFLALFLVFVTALTILTGIPDHEDAPDFYTLLFGSVIGMMLMAGANNLLMMFLSVEMASVPSYVMAGFLKGRRQSSEAALKFVVYGAGSAGVMLYGITLVAGLLGTGDFAELADRLRLVLGDSPRGLGDPAVRLLALGLLMIVVGFAFKLSVFPFHFWCPDAFQGAAAEVAGFLSVASKAGAFALLVRFSIALTSHAGAVTSSISLGLGVGLGMLAILSVTYGNLAAYSQTNIKRLLAYSTISHAGFMLMGVAAMLVLHSSSSGPAATIAAQSSRALQGLLYYLSVYFFMNLGAFSVVALIRNQIFSEDIDDYRGVAYQAPLAAIAMLFFFFSLIGIPPFGGFIGKFMVFASVFEASSVHWSMWIVLVVGAVNAVIALFYYLRVLKVMIIDTRPEGARPVLLPPNSVAGMFVMLLAIPVLYPLGIDVNRLSQIASRVALVFFSN